MEYFAWERASVGGCLQAAEFQSTPCDRIVKIREIYVIVSMLEMALKYLILFLQLNWPECERRRWRWCGRSGRGNWCSYVPTPQCGGQKVKGK